MENLSKNFSSKSTNLKWGEKKKRRKQERRYSDSVSQIRMQYERPKKAEKRTCENFREHIHAPRRAKSSTCIILRKFRHESETLGSYKVPSIKVKIFGFNSPPSPPLRKPRNTPPSNPPPAPHNSRSPSLISHPPMPLFGSATVSVWLTHPIHSAPLHSLHQAAAYVYPLEENKSS